MNAVKMFVIAAVTFVAGMALGGVAPRSQMRHLQDQLAGLSERDCESGLSQDLRRLLSGNPMGVAAPAPTTPPIVVQPPEESESDPPPMKANEGVHLEWNTDDDAPDGGPTDDVPDMTALADAGLHDALDLRRTQARARLEETAWPDDGQLAIIDGAYAQMNDDLATIASDFAAEFDPNVQPSRRELMMLAADTLEVMLAAEETVLRSLDDEQFDNVDLESTDPFAHIDPSILNALAEMPR